MKRFLKILVVGLACGLIVKGVLFGTDILNEPDPFDAGRISHPMTLAEIKILDKYKPDPIKPDGTISGMKIILLFDSDKLDNCYRYYSLNDDIAKALLEGSMITITFCYPEYGEIMIADIVRGEKLSKEHNKFYPIGSGAELQISKDEIVQGGRKRNNRFNMGEPSPPSPERDVVAR